MGTLKEIRSVRKGKGERRGKEEKGIEEENISSWYHEKGKRGTRMENERKKERPGRDRVNIIDVLNFCLFENSFHVFI